MTTRNRQVLECRPWSIDAVTAVDWHLMQMSIPFQPQGENSGLLLSWQSQSEGNSNRISKPSCMPITHLYCMTACFLLSWKHFGAGRCSLVPLAKGCRIQYDRCAKVYIRRYVYHDATSFWHMTIWSRITKVTARTFAHPALDKFVDSEQIKPPSPSTSSRWLAADVTAIRLIPLR